ncbi:MAG: hypothetical protein C4339_03445 [Nitrososphaerota archaeon]
MLQVDAAAGLVVGVAVPFVMGLLVGAAVKRTIKLLVVIMALALLLVAFGYVSLSFSELLRAAQAYLPKLLSAGGQLLNILPYSSAAFLVGLALGLWKG